MFSNKINSAFQQSLDLIATLRKLEDESSAFGTDKMSRRAIDSVRNQIKALGISLTRAERAELNAKYQNS